MAIHKISITRFIEQGATLFTPDSFSIDYYPNSSSEEFIYKFLLEHPLCEEFKQVEGCNQFVAKFPLCKLQFIRDLFTINGFEVAETNKPN